jgi:hypothetical protein
MILIGISKSFFYGLNSINYLYYFLMILLMFSMAKKKKETCPYCGNKFVNLSRHVCKQAPKEAKKKTAAKKTSKKTTSKKKKSSSRKTSTKKTNSQKPKRPPNPNPKPVRKEKTIRKLIRRFYQYFRRKNRFFRMIYF